MRSELIKKIANQGNVNTIVFILKRYKLSKWQTFALIRTNNRLRINKTFAIIRVNNIIRINKLIKKSV
jgi:hypothetical protein